MLADLRHRLRALFRRGQVDRELDEELRFHLERLTEKHLAAGLPPDEATRRARVELGPLAATRDDHRDARGIRLLDTLGQDLRHGLRSLARAPGFTAVAVLTLALGIGANTAMFSVVNATLLHPLPFPQPESLVRLDASKPGFDQGSVSYPIFRDWRALNHSLAESALSRGAGFMLTGMGAARNVHAELIAGDYFALAGGAPVLGRLLGPPDDEPAAPPTVVLGEAFWRWNLGADPDVVGKPITLDGRSYIVAGVARTLPDLPLAGVRATDVYMPIRLWNNSALLNRAAGLGFHGLARLRPGVTLAQARADLAGVTAGLAEAHPETDKGTGAYLMPLDEAVLGGVRPYLVLLLGAVGFVLLIACVNVANLLLARAVVRRRELAVRAALGAGVGRLVRQLLTESLLLAVVGGGLGLLVAAWATHALVAVLPANLPRPADLGIDGRVLAFTCAASVAAGLIFGLVPAVRAARPDLLATLQHDGRVGAARARAQRVFVVVEMALAVVLLAGAGLMVRTLARLAAVDPGFRTDGVMTLGAALPPELRGAGPERARAALRELDRAIAGAPGVEASSLSWGALPLDSDDELLFWRDGRPRPTSIYEQSWALRYCVGPDYLAAMRIPLLRGRFLDARDVEDAPPVVVVDEVFARQYFPGEEVLGQRVHLDDFEEPATIVGVVGHVNQWGLDRDDASEVRAEAYLSFWQLGPKPLAMAVGGVDVVVRGPTTLVALRAATGEDKVLFGARTMDEIVSETLATRRFAMLVLAGFALAALVLACVGIYGVIGYVVSQRSHEIGVRMALGARRADILRLVLRQGLEMAAAGVAIGVVVALALGRLMGDLIHGVAATDPVTFVAVGVLLIAVAVGAAWIPARRATRVDPMLALRHE